MKNAVTAAILQAIDKSFNALFNKGKSRVVGYVKKLKFMVVQSNSAEEMYGWIKDIPALDKNAAELQISRLAADGQSVKNNEYTKGLAIKRSAIEDDQYNIFGPAMQLLGQRGAQVSDFDFLDLLAGAFTTVKAYTGVSFFNTAHKIGKYTFSNKDTKKLSAANFQTGYAALRDMQDGQGKPLFTLMDPSSVFLLVGPDYEATADSIVKLAKLADGGDNPNFNKAQVEVIPGLGDAWMILDCGQVITPFIFQDRIPLTLTAALGDLTPNVLLQEEFLWKARARSAMGPGEPRFAWGSTGADPAA